MLPAITCSVNSVCLCDDYFSRPVIVTLLRLWLFLVFFRIRRKARPSGQYLQMLQLLHALQYLLPVHLERAGVSNVIKSMVCQTAWLPLKGAKKPGYVRHCGGV
jgi:hypothetical protein